VRDDFGDADMDRLNLIRELEVVRENSLFDPDNLSVKKIAKPVIGELIEQFVLWVETDYKEIEKVFEARARANNTQSLFVVLDNLWVATGKYPDKKDRQDLFFSYLGKTAEDSKTVQELDKIIADEYQAAGQTLKASDAAMAGRGINVGVGLLDSNPAVPEYGTIFSKYYAGDPDLAKSLLLLSFAARIIMLFQDDSKSYAFPRIDRDPENSCLRGTGGELLDLLRIRVKDIAATETDPMAMPEFPKRGDIKKKYCQKAIRALDKAFDGDTFTDKGQSIHYKGLEEIFTSKNYPENEAKIVRQRLQDARKRITSACKVYCPEAVSEIAYSPA